MYRGNFKTCGYVCMTLTSDKSSLFYFHVSLLILPCLAQHIKLFPLVSTQRGLIVTGLWFLLHTPSEQSWVSCTNRKVWKQLLVCSLPTFRNLSRKMETFLWFTVPFESIQPPWTFWLFATFQTSNIEGNFFYFLWGINNNGDKKY